MRNALPRRDCKIQKILYKEFCSRLSSGYEEDHPMAQRKLSKVKKIVDQYRRILEKKIRVERIILYGSHAYGTPHDGSDIDLVVISPDFVRMHPLRRLEYLSLARREMKEPIEALGYTPKEFRRARESILLDEIVERGVVLHQN